MPQEHVAAERGAKVVCSGFAEVSAESSGVCVCVCVMGKENAGMGFFFSQYNTLREHDFLPKSRPDLDPNLNLTFAGCFILAFHLSIGNHSSMLLLLGDAWY